MLSGEAPFAGRLELRGVQEADLELFFEFQRDPQACRMAAFTARDPADRAAFDAFWGRIRANPAILIRTILADGQTAGSVLRYVEDGRPEVSYWLGRAFWGRGIATRALGQFLLLACERPIFARAAADNTASRRVLEKCGFRVIEHGRGYANARQAEIDELLLKLD